MWLADGTTKRVDQLLPTDRLLDELGEAIEIDPSTLIGTVHFPQPLPLLPNGLPNPLAAPGTLVPTRAQGAYVPPLGTTTVNPGYQAKRRISGVYEGFQRLRCERTDHPLTVGNRRVAKSRRQERPPRPHARDGLPLPVGLHLAGGAGTPGAGWPAHLWLHR